jgi:hypothetical protein
MHLSPSSNCPSTCGCTLEDDDHLLCCPHPDCRLHNISNLILELWPLFDKHHIDPWLATADSVFCHCWNTPSDHFQPHGAYSPIPRPCGRPTKPRAACSVLRGLPRVVGHPTGPAPTPSPRTEPSASLRGIVSPPLPSHSQRTMGHTQ